MKTFKLHRAWYMLFGCCLIQGGSLGIIHNCRGIFFAPIIADLGFGMGAFTFFVLMFGVFSCLILPFMGKLFSRYNVRLLLSIASIVFAGSVIAMGFLNTLPAFYIAGAIQGLSGAFLLFYPAPLILGHWFKKKTGLAVGLSSAFSGLAGIVGNPVGNAVIEAFGWRVGYFFLGAVSLIMLLPVSAFLLRLRPEDEGLTAYGAEDRPEKEGPACPLSGVPAPAAKKTVAFWLLILGALFSANICAYHNQLSPIGTYAGYGAAVGAWMMSASMGGNITSKIVLGSLYDRLGLGKPLAVGTGACVIGFLMLLVNNPAVRLVGSFFYGTTMAMSAVMMAVSVKDVYGTRGYNELLPFASMSATLGTSATTVVIGYVVDGLGTTLGYTVSLWGGVGMACIMALLLAVSIRGGRKLAAAYASAEIS